MGFSKFLKVYAETNDELAQAEYWDLFVHEGAYGSRKMWKIATQKGNFG